MLNLLMRTLLFAFLFSIQHALAQEISSVTDKAVSRFTLHINGVEEAEGEIRIAVFNSSETYTKETVFAEILQVSNTEISWTIPELPHGDYAIAVYHDRNTNGKLDTNFLGIPREVYGFSNNARGKFGPASWEEAHFSVDEGNVTHTIRLQ